MFSTIYQIWQISDFRSLFFFLFSFNFRANDLETYIKFFGVYSSTLTRCVPYLIGIIFGFIIDRFEWKLENFKLPIKYQVILWLYVSQFLMIRDVFKVPCDLTDCKNNIMFYVLESSHKIFWSLSIGWIIFACHFKMGGIVNRILSNSFWIPIAKISLSLYLMHSIVQINYLSVHPLETNFEASVVVS